MKKIVVAIPVGIVPSAMYIQSWEQNKNNPLLITLYNRVLFSGFGKSKMSCHVFLYSLGATINAIIGRTIAQRKTKIKREFAKLEFRTIPSKSPNRDFGLKITLVTTFWNDNSKEDVKIKINPLVKWLCWFETGAGVGGDVGSAICVVSSSASILGEVLLLDFPDY